MRARNQGQVTQQQFRDNRRDARQDFRADRRDDRQEYRGNNYDRGPGYTGNGYNRGPAYNRGGNRNRNWRGDNRYDWHRYRSSNRNAYRLPRYYAPRGWNYGYRRFGVGFTLSSILFSSSYWIDDPFYYRLPPAYGQYRWVRYYNDALLVDIRTGEVVDVEYDIFW